MKGENTMIRSMYAGITGMKNFQTKLDVIGNNIANVNTFGFKKGRVTFQDLVSQQISGASAPGAQGPRGGVNPRQVGLGAQLASIDMVNTQGSLQTTGRPLDIGISGEGFFVVAEMDNGVPINYYFTRAGNFYLDQNGNLVNSQGLYVLDINEEPINIPLDTQSFSIASDGSVNIVNAIGELNADGPPQRLGLAKFDNSEGLEKVGGNVFRATANSGQFEEIFDPGTEGVGILVAGTLEMSNVDLSEEFTEMIVAQRGFQANTRMITTSDEILQEIMQMKR